MDNSHRSRHLDAQDLHDLLGIPVHEVKALIENDDPDSFPYTLTTYTPRGGGRTPLAAFMEAL